MKLQIGVIGSMSDTKLSGSLKKRATELGQAIAQNQAILVFGFEGDFDSLSEIAARSAQQAGGQTLAFVWGNKKADLKDLDAKQVVTGQQRGGGREFSFILSCDSIICLSGGSGTLMEIAMAYQAGIPVISIKNSGGWSEKLAGKFLDNRKRLKILVANSAKEAVGLALKQTQEKIAVENKRS